MRKIIAVILMVVLPISLAYLTLKREDGSGLVRGPVGPITIEDLIRNAETYNGQDIRIVGRISLGFEAMYIQAPQYPLSAHLWGEKVYLSNVAVPKETIHNAHGKIVVVTGHFTLARQNLKQLGFVGTLTNLEHIRVLES